MYSFSPKYLSVVFCSLLALSTPTFAGKNGFDHNDDPLKPVGRGGALLVKKYPKNHPDKKGEQLCILFGHDKNLDCWAPPAGGVKYDEDYDKKNGTYSSIKTIQREVDEETGGHVKLTEDQIRKSPLLYSPRFQNLLSYNHDDNLSCSALQVAVICALTHPKSTKDQREMDNYEAFPATNVLEVARKMRARFETIPGKPSAKTLVSKLPKDILSSKITNYEFSPLVRVRARSGEEKDVCAYYMGTIADMLPELEALLFPPAKPVISAPVSVTSTSKTSISIPGASTAPVPVTTSSAPKPVVSTTKDVAPTPVVLVSNPVSPVSDPAPKASTSIPVATQPAPEPLVVKEKEEDLAIGSKPAWKSPDSIFTKNPDGSHTLITDKTGAYQLLEPFPLKNTPAVQLSYEFDIQEGNISMGLLSQDQSKWLQPTLSFTKGIRKGTLNIATDGQSQVFLTLQNNLAGQASKVTLKKLKVSLLGGAHSAP
jgi:8-oxo-dGTP pyrophosphatase MutT (NUDIX family)